jgi:hypothetical protein
MDNLDLMELFQEFVEFVTKKRIKAPGLNTGVNMGNNKEWQKGNEKCQKGEVNLAVLPGFIGEKENCISETERSKNDSFGDKNSLLRAKAHIF